MVKDRKDRKAKNKQVKHNDGQTVRLNKQRKRTYIAVGLGLVLLILFMVANAVMSNVHSGQLNANKALNEYRLGSKNLTYSVQSYAVTGDQIYYEQYMKELNEEKNRENALAELKKLDITDEEWKELNEIVKLSESLVPLEEEALEYAGKGDIAKAQSFVFSQKYEDTVVQINDLTADVINQIQDRKGEQQKLLSIVLVIYEVFLVISFLYVAFEVARLIVFAKKELLEPIQKVSVQMSALAGGDFHQELDLKEDSSEVGTMVSSIQFMKKNLLGMVEEISEILELMGNGNYHIQVQKEYVGEFVRIKESFIKIGGKMRETLLLIREASEQIDKGSEQLACAAEDLADGSTKQAGQVAELVTAVEDMSKSMERNATAAEESVKIASQAGEILQIGNHKMQDLKEAIGEISSCSEQIGSIIGAIEDIASQTNLLSLNAAIEAARAGEAGKGFAVVAEQVKNLAEESAKAAGKTTELIETTIATVERGITIADETAVSMGEVMDGARVATEKMGQIAEMLEQDVEHMHRVNASIMEVSSVVDNNSATSEETAAVSEEQKAQVETMVSMMDKFVI